MLQKKCNPLELIQTHDVEEQEENEDGTYLLVSSAPSLMENLFFFCLEISLKIHEMCYKGSHLLCVTLSFYIRWQLPTVKCLTRPCWHKALPSNCMTLICVGTAIVITRHWNEFIQLGLLESSSRCCIFLYLFMVYFYVVSSSDYIA